MDLKDHIASIPDFPKPGILFYDVSTLLRNPAAWQEAVDRMTTAWCSPGSRACWPASNPAASCWQPRWR